MKKCRAMERAMAASSHTLVSGPITRRDWFSLRLWMERGGEGRGKTSQNVWGRKGEGDLLSALSISMVTRTERAMVMGWRSANTLQLSRSENTSFSLVHWRW